MSFLTRYEELGVVFDPSDVHMKKSLRVNTLKADKTKTIDALKKKGVKLERISFAPGYYYEADFSLGATPLYLQGYYYLQEAASQLSPLVLNVDSGDAVLDMCAAPGSKTTQIAEMMGNEGLLVALDTEPRRLTSLRNNLERLGVKNTILFKKDARFIADLKKTFDKILLDAPCSGNFCIEPNFFQTKTLDGVRSRARLQKELLKAAYKVLNKGGTLVYSTCSLEPEEDELMINWFIEKFPDMMLVDTGLSVAEPGLTKVFGQDLSPSLAKTRRFWPHKTSTQGFFIAKMIKKDA